MIDLLGELLQKLNGVLPKFVLKKLGMDGGIGKKWMDVNVAAGTCSNHSPNIEKAGEFLSTNFCKSRNNSIEEYLNLSPLHFDQQGESANG